MLVTRQPERREQPDVGAAFEWVRPNRCDAVRSMAVILTNRVDAGKAQHALALLPGVDDGSHSLSLESTVGLEDRPCAGGQVIGF